MEQNDSEVMVSFLIFLTHDTVPT